MSLPPELRILCLRLTSTPIEDLPKLTPSLVQYITHCQIPLSNPSSNGAKSDAPQSSVLVHKLKTQLTTLLNGKSVEGRFTAVVLIKAVVDVGGWEILRDAGSWVRGLLSVLGKSDPIATKELCIVSLTKIYCMTHQYQTLVREITTPTLPTFVTSCLNVISKSQKADAYQSFVECILRSFTTLLPRHTTIFRPFATQLRAVTRPYLAPTFCDRVYVPDSLKDSARQLTVVIHQTVAKNGGGEEWGKGIRNLVKDIHMTADQVFRAIVEDWESNAGYTAEAVDVNQELSGGARTPEDVPSWTGIDSGIERLVGLTALLENYLSGPTSSAVTIPLGSIFDLTTRLLSISSPASWNPASASVRLHPAIDRDERDALSTGLPQIYVSVLQLVNTMAEMLGQTFMSMAQGSLDLLIWCFSSGKHDPAFRAIAYTVLAKILSLTGQSLDKSRVTKLVPIMRSCCKDLETGNPGTSNSEVNRGEINTGSSQNADTILKGSMSSPLVVDPIVVEPASALLPALLSYLPQGYLDISMRSLLERTAILGRNKDAMLASILNPFVGRNGKALSSILPHITREFAHDDVVEILLRPRMPLIPSRNIQSTVEDVEIEDDAMDGIAEVINQQDEDTPVLDIGTQQSIPEHQGLASSINMPVADTQQGFGFNSSLLNNAPTSLPPPIPKPQSNTLQPSAARTDTEMSYDNDDDGSDSDSDTSVHLTMQIDSDSE